MQAQNPDYVDTRMRVEPQARIYLQPIAAPSILGLFALGAATFIFAAFMARWFGNAATPAFLIPFAGFFGGITQLLAAMWAYKARDGVATALHGLWGSVWVSYALLYVLLLTGKVTMPTGTNQAIGFWFIPIAVITLTGAWVSMAQSWGMFTVWGLAGLASVCFAIANFLSSGALVALSGWIFFLTSLAAWYTATSLMAEEAFGRVVLPLGRTAGGPNVPMVEIGTGEPGVIHGQYGRDHNTAYVPASRTRSGAA